MEQQELSSIEAAFAGTDLPLDLQIVCVHCLWLRKKYQKWVIKQGSPSCKQCGLPLIQTARETFCLSCKQRKMGRIVMQTRKIWLGRFYFVFTSAVPASYGQRYYWDF